ncbi:hypothetical protein SDC9_71676 [bioreactor metagenome]|uniref:Carotenoid biosynthesis protein n=1 Tax=bioreactor metagenome TaxID=1076179 RepID=A0A644Y9E5_9ZZZZ
MSWLNGFELLCYCITALSIVSFIRRKDSKALFAFGTGALVGFTMELLAVKFAGQYHYNTAFWLAIGARPNQFPVFGGLMWGILISYSIKIAQKFRFRKFMKALVAGFLIVTMDLFLDVVAIRLDGGFWAWEGQPINLAVNAQAFMGVSWINFLGYMVMAPAVAWLILRSWDIVGDSNLKKQALYMLLNFISGVAIAGAGNVLNLLLNQLTNSVSSFVLFVIVWVALAVLVAQRTLRARFRCLHAKDWNWPMFLFWMANYLYSLVAILHLKIQLTHLWYFIFGILAMLITAFFCLSEPIGAAAEGAGN